MNLQSEKIYSFLKILFYRDFFKIWLFFLKIDPFLLSIKYKNRVFKLQKNKYNSARTCHIFGNGMSVMNTFNLVDETDYVIKINSGAIIPGRTDIWLSESHPESDITLLKIGGTDQNVKYFKMLKNYVLSRNPYCISLMKNLWRNNIPLEVYDHDNDLFVLQDYLIRPQPNDMELLSFIVEHIISDESNVVGQMHTSLLTALVIAYKLGFREIVIHGLDGRGSHFFHHDSFDKMDTLPECDIIKYLRESSPKVNDQDVYSPGLKGLEIYDVYFKALSRRNIKVITGVEFKKFKSLSANKY